MSDAVLNPPAGPPAVARSNATPPGWAADELTKFLQETHQQQYATFHNKKQAVGLLIAIDELFVRVSKNWLNPASEVVAMLFLRCHAAFRAAAGTFPVGVSRDAVMPTWSFKLTFVDPRVPEAFSLCQGEM